MDDHELLRAISRKVEGLSLRLDDMLAAIHRVEYETGATRGSLSAMRRDVRDVAERGFDHEVRLRGIEGEFDGSEQSGDGDGEQSG